MSNELLYQLQATSAKLIIVHPEALETAVTVARSTGFPLERIVVFNVESTDTPKGFASVSDLVKVGLERPPNFVEPVIDAKTKLAFLSFSSGRPRH